MAHSSPCNLHYSIRSTRNARPSKFTRWRASCREFGDKSKRENREFAHGYTDTRTYGHTDTRTHGQRVERKFVGRISSRLAANISHFARACGGTCSRLEAAGRVMHKRLNSESCRSSLMNPSRLRRLVHRDETNLFLQDVAHSRMHPRRRPVIHARVSKQERRRKTRRGTNHACRYFAVVMNLSPRERCPLEQSLIFQTFGGRPPPSLVSELLVSKCDKATYLPIRIE